MPLIPSRKLSAKRAAEIQMVLSHGEPVELLTIEFIGLLEGVIRSAIPANYPEDWDEDFLTRTLLRSLRSDIAHVRLIDQTGPVWIYWRAWKQVGTAEHTFGDIAVHVKIRGARTPAVEGVGFLEAKRRYHASGKFEALDWKQLERIVATAPHAMVLLYDSDPIKLNPLRAVPSIITTPRAARTLPSHIGYPFPPWPTYAVVVPQNLVLATKDRSARIYRFALPLSHQLVARFFNAQDLEFSDAALSVARGQNRELGVPRYLVTVSIGFGVAPDEIEVNTNLYRDLIGAESAG